MGRRGKHNNRGSKNHSKGPQLSDSERLWKRLASHFSHEQGNWSIEWSGDSIADYLIQREKLDADFAKDQRSERAFRSSINEIIAHARSKNEHFVEVENKCVRIRTPNETEQIKSSTLDWKAFTTVHASKGKTGLHGRPAIIQENAHLIPSMNQEDIERYALLEEVWMAHLSGNDYPDSFSLLKDEVVRSWLSLIHI